MASAMSPQMLSPVVFVTKAGPGAEGATDSSQRALVDGWTLTSAKDEAKLLAPPCTLAFVYGTLKRGFGNHWLMEEQLASGHARFVGVASTRKRFPLVCGPFQVPFLLNIPSQGHRVRGEVYEVDRVALGKLDDLEGVGKGHYVRCPVLLTDLQLSPPLEALAQDPSVCRTLEFEAEAYFADPHYTPGMVQAPHIVAYTEEEAATYVRRKDRPQDKSFLEHVYSWIECRDDGCTLERVI